MLYMYVTYLEKMVALGHKLKPKLGLKKKKLNEEKKIVTKF